MKKRMGMLFTAATAAVLSFTAFAEGDIVETFVSDDQIVVELVSVTEDETGYTWNLNIENKTDKEILFDLSQPYVNGLLLNPSYATARIAANETGALAVTWSAEDLEKYEVGDITEISCELSAFETEEYETYFRDTYTVHPLGDDAVVYYERSAKDTDAVLLDNEYFTMLYVGNDTNVWDELITTFYVVNKMDSSCYLDTSDWMVNDSVEISSQYLSVILPANTSSYQEVSWSDYKLTDTGLTSDMIGTAQFTAAITNFDTWDIVSSDTLRIVIDDSVDTTAAPAPIPEGETEVNVRTDPEVTVKLDPDAAVRASGAEGKSWTDFFQK